VTYAKLRGAKKLQLLSIPLEWFVSYYFIVNLTKFPNVCEYIALFYM